ncbi:DNA-methyltransferase [Petrachloros mirabilis]
MTPYFQDERVTLYQGRAEHILPHLGTFDAVITDPPYGETSLEWDRWPQNWPTLAAVAPQLWCFGSFRMFMDRGREFMQWKLAQDIVWEKHNGSNSSNDRFRRVHELAAHFYRGDWSALYLDPQYTQDATARTVRRKSRPPQWGELGESSYASEDGGPRLMRSVIYSRSCHGQAVNETQKPEALIAPLVAYSVPPGGVVLDCFAGSGTTLAVAVKLGRRAIGIELREEQCERIVERLSQKDLIA